MKTLFTFILMSAFFASSQTEISGVVYDTDSTGLENATLQVFKGDSLIGTCLTVEEGWFHAEFSFSGNVKLVIEAPGFRSLTLLDVQEVELMSIYLEQPIIEYVPPVIEKCLCSYRIPVRLSNIQNLRNPAIP